MGISFRDATGRLLSRVEIEEEIARLKFRFRRSKRIEDDEDRGNAFLRVPNWGIPVPYDHRPISSTGRVSFYFEHKTITKRRLPRKKAKKGREDKLSDFHPDAQEHESYVSREDAVLRVTSCDYEAYLGRDGAVAEAGAGQPAIFSNISANADERIEFWKAVTRCERNGSPDKVTFCADRLSAAQWQTIRDMTDAPPELVKAADQMMRHRSASAGEDGGQKTTSIGLDRVDFEKVRRLLKGMEAWDRKDPPITIKKGRGGRTQQRIVAAFPDGLDVVAMLRVTQRYCAWLAKKKMMYTAVIHAPDFRNDRRNYHLHLIYYERPCRYLEEHGCWDFEYREPVPGQWNRFRYPERQNKITELSKPPKDCEENPWDFRARKLYSLRAMFSVLCNQELQKLGINSLLDPRRYNEMGIEQEPCEKLGPKGSALQAAGVATEKDIRNAERTWNRAFAFALEESAKKKRMRDRARQAAVTMRTALATDNVDLELVQNFDRLIAAFDKLALSIGDEEEDRDIFMLAWKMSSSRAEKTRDYCERLLEAIEDGRASRAEANMAERVAERLKEATAYLEAEDLQPNEMAELVHRAEEIQKQAHQLQSVITDINRLVDELRPWWESRQFETARASLRTDVPVAATLGRGKDRRSRAVAAYFEDPIGYEEDWNSIFDTINLEEMEIRPPVAGSKLGFHVPGISKQDLEMLLNPIFYKRSQARLEAIHDIRQFKQRRVEVASLDEAERKAPEPAVIATISPVASDEQRTLAFAGEQIAVPAAQFEARSLSDAPPTANDVPGSLPERQPLTKRPASQQVRAKLPSRGPKDVHAAADAGRNREIAAPDDGETSPPPAVNTSRYDELAKRAILRHEEERRLAVLEWLDEIASKDRWKKATKDQPEHLPVLRGEEGLVLDVMHAPDDKRKEIFFDDPIVMERLREEEDSRRHEVELLVRCSAKQLVRNVGGEPQYDRREFQNYLWPYLDDMFRHDSKIVAVIEERAQISAVQIEESLANPIRSPETQSSPSIRGEESEEARDAELSRWYQDRSAAGYGD